MVEVLQIDSGDVAEIIYREESHFSDVKGRDIVPASLSKTISAFANTAGGEVYVGVSEDRRDGKKKRVWQGFEDQEAANPIFAIREHLGATDVVAANFLISDDQEGLFCTSFWVRVDGLTEQPMAIRISEEMPRVSLSGRLMPSKGSNWIKGLRRSKTIPWKLH